jgi:hypothetical protein
VSSTLACAGLPVTDEQQLSALLDRIMPEVQELGRTGRKRVVRWTDPSGARLVLDVTDEGVVDLLPSFRSGTTVLLGDLRAVNSDVAIASLLDEDGEEMTSVALALEQRRLLPRQPVARVRASLTALGVDVVVHPDAGAFESSDASLLDPDASGGAPPSTWERDWPWPPRVAANSLLSYGVFAEVADATAHARLAGEVLLAERRTVQATGADVVVAEVRTAGFSVTVCLEGAAHPQTPVPGNVLSGTVLLTASLEEH